MLKTAKWWLHAWSLDSVKYLFYFKWGHKNQQTCSLCEEHSFAVKGIPLAVLTFRALGLIFLIAYTYALREDFLRTAAIFSVYKEAQGGGQAGRVHSISMGNLYGQERKLIYTMFPVSRRPHTTLSFHPPGWILQHFLIKSPLDSL